MTKAFKLRKWAKSENRIYFLAYLGTIQVLRHHRHHAFDFFCAHPTNSLLPFSDPTHLFDVEYLNGDARFFIYSLRSHIFQFGYFCFSHFWSGIVCPKLIFAAHNSAFHNLALA